METPAFRQEVGLNEDQSKILYNATKRTFLDDLFKDPVTLEIDNKAYTIQRSTDGFYVQSK